MVILQKKNWLIRHVEPTDQKVLTKWLRNPRVLEFYEGRDRPYTEEMVYDEFIGVQDAIERCIIIYHDQPLGYIQVYPLDEETQKLYRISGEQLYGMDQFIGEPDYWNRGLGTELVSMMANFLMEKRHAKKIYMDPQVRNPRALRCYEKAGFQKVHYLPKHELHEGTYEDCWLIVYSGE